MKWEPLFCFPNAESYTGFHPPSCKNVNKLGFKYNDLQHYVPSGRAKLKRVPINGALWLSKRSASLNLSYRVVCESVCACTRTFSGSNTQTGMCKPARARISMHNTQTADLGRVPSPPLRHIIEKHVDVIRSFCSTLEAVSRRSERRQRYRGNYKS